MAEQHPFKVMVGGSSPPGVTRYAHSPFVLDSADNEMHTSPPGVTRFFFK